MCIVCPLLYLLQHPALDPQLSVHTLQDVHRIPVHFQGFVWCILFIILHITTFTQSKFMFACTLLVVTIRGVK